jgi:hypothetical protein
VLTFVYYFVYVPLHVSIKMIIRQFHIIRHSLLNCFLIILLTYTHQDANNKENKEGRSHAFKLYAKQQAALTPLITYCLLTVETWFQSQGLCAQVVSEVLFPRTSVLPCQLSFHQCSIYHWCCQHVTTVGTQVGNVVCVCNSNTVSSWQTPVELHVANVKPIIIYDGTKAFLTNSPAQNLILNLLMLHSI